jgi:hypothetical protein
MSFIIVHSHLEVPVGGGPGSHELSAGGGEQAVNNIPPPTPPNSSNRQSTLSSLVTNMPTVM